MRKYTGGGRGGRCTYPGERDNNEKEHVSEYGHDTHTEEEQIGGKILYIHEGGGEQKYFIY